MSSGPFAILDYRHPIQRLRRTLPKTLPDGSVDFGSALSAEDITGDLQLNPELDTFPQPSGSEPRGDAAFYTEADLVPSDEDDPDTGDVVRAFLDNARTKWEDFNVVGVLDRHTITDALLGIPERKGFILRRRKR